MESLLPSAGLALAVALLATPLLRRVLLRVRLLDHPNAAHKTHDAPAPSLGGVAVVLAVAIAIAFAGLAPEWGLPVYGACGGVFLLGVLDDVMDVSAWRKLLVEVICAGAICAAGMRLPLGPVWIAVPLTIAWLVACANGFNLTDGADGLATLVGAIAAAGLCAIAALGGQVELGLLFGVMAAALFGFLIFNFPPASIFLGDSGALPIGFTLGVGGIAWARHSADAVASLAPVFLLALPLAETALSFTRRALRGDPIFRADRRHIHHRLAALGLRPSRLTLACGLYSLLGAATALVVASYGLSGVSSITVALFSGMTAVAVHMLRYTEFDCAARAILEGRRPWRLAGTIRAIELRQALEAAEDPEERWQRMDAAMREMGFQAVRLLDGAGTPLRQSSPLQQADHVWKMTVILPGGEGVLEASRGPGKQQAAPVPDAVTDALRKAFADAVPDPAPASASGRLARSDRAAL